MRHCYSDTTPWYSGLDTPLGKQAVVYVVYTMGGVFHVCVWVCVTVDAKISHLANKNFLKMVSFKCLLVSHFA